MKNLAPPIYRPLLWMVPGFAFTVLAYWYPNWVDQTIPPEFDSRIWMIIGMALGYTWWASVAVIVAFSLLVARARKFKEPHSRIPITNGVVMFAPSAWLAVTIGAIWLRH